MLTYAIVGYTVFMFFTNDSVRGRFDVSNGRGGRGVPGPSCVGWLVLVQ